MEALSLRHSSSIPMVSQTLSVSSLPIKSSRAWIDSIPILIYLVIDSSPGTKASSKEDLTRLRNLQSQSLQKRESERFTTTLSYLLGEWSFEQRGGFGCEDGPLLPWNVRLKIAKEVAIAVTYLHTAFSRIIIHRDIKPTNVFLDKNWTAKLTDFTFSVSLPEGKSWIEDEVMGTLGYMDPIYYTTGLVTEYTDVFSFGIFMLVLLLGRPAVFAVSGGVCNILDYVKDLQERGESVEFGNDLNDMRTSQMHMFLKLALRCCEERNEDRPKMILVAKEIKLIEGLLDC